VYVDPLATTSTIPAVNPTPSMTVTPSVVSMTSSVVLTTSSPPVALVPTNVMQTARGLTSVQVQWSSVQDSDYFFHVQLSCRPSCLQDAVRNFTTMDKSLTINSLQPNQIYTLQVAHVADNEIVGLYSDPIQVSTITSGKCIVTSCCVEINFFIFYQASASVKEVVIAERRFKEANLQWRIDEALTKDLLHFEIQHNGQDIATVNTSNVLLAVPVGIYAITITAVYRLNGSGSTWSSESVPIEIEQFGKYCN